ncbi:hypothetical protein [Paraliobacillus ryukyuensis]|uniref:hypothetical protein n=1 Tax=Paraliobacillus ryukyuensis TaxID=200904 RepID=UPI0009A710CC|nr:hypothetical protein [Paraliobacillus ryukyuensis]
MTDKEFFDSIHNELYKNGSCITDAWFTVTIKDNEKVATLETMQPSKGNIRIRKPFKRARINANGEQIFLYDVYRFNNKYELKNDGIIEGLRSEVKELVR